MSSCTVKTSSAEGFSRISKLAFVEDNGIFSMQSSGLSNIGSAHVHKFPAYGCAL